MEILVWIHSLTQMDTEECHFLYLEIRIPFTEAFQTRAYLQVWMLEIGMEAIIY